MRCIARLSGKLNELNDELIMSCPLIASPLLIRFKKATADKKGSHAKTKPSIDYCAIVAT